MSYNNRLYIYHVYIFFMYFLYLVHKFFLFIYFFLSFNYKNTYQRFEKKKKKIVTFGCVCVHCYDKRIYECCFFMEIHEEGGVTLFSLCKHLLKCFINFFHIYIFFSQNFSCQLLARLLVSIKYLFHLFVF